MHSAYVRASDRRGVACRTLWAEGPCGTYCLKTGTSDQSVPILWGVWSCRAAGSLLIHTADVTPSSTHAPSDITTTHPIRVRPPEIMPSCPDTCTSIIAHCLALPTPPSDQVCHKLVCVSQGQGTNQKPAMFYAIALLGATHHRYQVFSETRIIECDATSYQASNFCFCFCFCSG